MHKMHCQISPRRTCNPCGFTTQISSRYHRLLIYDVSRNTKIDGMGPFKHITLKATYFPVYKRYSKYELNISHTTTSPDTPVSLPLLHIEHRQCSHGFPIHVVPELHTHLVIVVSQGWLRLHASIR